MISAGRLKQLNALVASGNESAFYSWTEWEHTRNDVLKMDNNECQCCKAKGKYSKGKIVHHVKHLTDRPDLALSIWDGKERQLITVCKACHEALHPESQRQYKNIRAPLTAERWD